MLQSGTCSSHRRLSACIFAVTGVLALAVATPTASATVSINDCHAQCDRTTCSYKPVRIANGSLGDILLQKGESVVALLLALIYPQPYTHSGMLIDYGYNARHNTADLDTNNFDGIIDSDLSMFDGFLGMGSVDYGDVRIDPVFLGKPGGMVTRGVSDWNRLTTVLLKPTNATAATATVNKLKATNFEYHLGAYTNYVRERDKNGSQCAGTVAYASQGTGGQFNTKYYYFSTTLLQNAWNILFAQVRSATYQSSSSGDLDSQGRDNIAKSIADQVMNCFRFGATENVLVITGAFPFTYETEVGCNRLNKAWRDFGSFSGYTVAPDDLRTQTQDAWSNTPVASQWDGGYYYNCQTTTDWDCYDRCAANQDCGGAGSICEPY